MARKSKIDFETKIKSVEMYLNGEKGPMAICEMIGVGKTSFYEWIHKYEKYGAEGLKASSKNTFYSNEIKMLAINDYMSGNGSLDDIALKYNISSRRSLQNWIMKYNNNHNINRSHNRIEGKIMIKGRKTTYDERIEIVAFCIENNDNYQLTSDKYKVSYQQAYTWVKKYKENGYEALVDSRGKSKNIEGMSDNEKLEAQIKLLKAQNKRLKMENAFLKKLEEIERRRV